MNYFLIKTDPATYSIEQLERDQTTTWDGIRNAQALRTIQQMRPGDLLLVYHSQSEAAIMGVARVTSEPRPDANESKSWVVEVEFVQRLARIVTLREVKESHLFDDWTLVRQSRLSTMPVPEAFVAWIKEKKVL